MLIVVFKRKVIDHHGIKNLILFVLCIVMSFLHFLPSINHGIISDFILYLQGKPYHSGIMTLFLPAFPFHPLYLLPTIALTAILYFLWLLVLSGVT